MQDTINKIIQLGRFSKNSEPVRAVQVVQKVIISPRGKDSFGWILQFCGAKLQNPTLKILRETAIWADNCSKRVFQLFTEKP